MIDENNDTKKVFKEQGTCSRTFFYLLNREFGALNDEEQKAADPFAGGIMQQGYQCGMLWGAVIAAGAEARRRSNGNSTARAIVASQHIAGSFAGRFGSCECYDITETNFASKLSMAKFIFLKARSCFKYAEKWAPEAVSAAKKGLAAEAACPSEQALSCASELARKMGADEEHAAMVAGFAGGIGLSGSGCGALAAAIWLNTIAWMKDNPGKSPYNNPKAKGTLDRFMKITGYELECRKIAGRSFGSLGEHTEYICNGGCAELIEKLALVE